MTNTFRRLLTGSALALLLTIGSVAFAGTPQGDLDAAIAEAQDTLGQISFEGAADPDALRKKLADMLARVARCEVGLLRDIKNALVGFLNSSAFDPLHDLANNTGTLSPEEDFFREVAKRLFGADGAIAKDAKNPDSFGLFSSLERAIAQDWYPPRDSSDVMKKLLDPLWDKALAGAVGEGKLGAAIRQLALVRKLLAQMANIRALHAKAYPPKSVPTTPGGAPTPPKAPSITPVAKVVSVKAAEAKRLLILATKTGKATKTVRVGNQRIIVTLSRHSKNKKLVCVTAKWQSGRVSKNVTSGFKLPTGKEQPCIAPKGKAATGEVWDMGDGWTITAPSIDAKAPPPRWVVLDLFPKTPSSALTPPADTSQPEQPRMLQLPPKISF